MREARGSGQKKQIGQKMIGLTQARLYDVDPERPVLKAIVKGQLEVDLVFVDRVDDHFGPPGKTARPSSERIKVTDKKVRDQSAPGEKAETTVHRHFEATARQPAVENEILCIIATREKQDALAH